LAEINLYLYNWLPNKPTDPFGKNPLELILPAYETLWRLVAHTFMYVEDTPGLTRPFLDFFNDPTTTQFAKPGISEGPSAQDILQEVLRLHPPTKRIKRTRDDFLSCIRRRIFGVTGFMCYSACSNIVAADVEALQRSSVWGPSPHEFDAMRHRAATEAQKACFMPFGLGPLKCVASSAAPRLAAMVVAGVAIRDDIELSRGESQGSRKDWGGWEIRRKF
jgi:cytochrome P450